MPDVLSQSEIDELLVAMSRGDADEAGVQTGHHVRPFDFMRPSKFSKDQLRTVELLHEVFCRSVQTQLSGVVRTPIKWPARQAINRDPATFAARAGLLGA